MELRLHIIETPVGLKRSMMSTYTGGCRLCNMLLLVFGYGIYPVEHQARKGRIRREYATPYLFLDEMIFKTRFEQVQRVQSRLEESVLRENIEPI